jgi:hypothetical protein
MLDFAFSTIILSGDQDLKVYTARTNSILMGRDWTLALVVTTVMLLKIYKGCQAFSEQQLHTSPIILEKMIYHSLLF